MGFWCGGRELTPDLGCGALRDWMGSYAVSAYPRNPF